MSRLEIVAMSGVVYKVKSTGPSTEPCGTHMRVDLYGLVPILQIRRKRNLSLARFHTNRKVYLLM